MDDDRDPAPQMQRGAIRMSKVGTVAGGIGAAALASYLIYRKK
jgi:hypothetical protein